MRINKFLSEEGICSRREADKLVETSAIFVNGEVAKLGQQLSDGDEIRYGDLVFIFDNESKDKKEYFYIALNKPQGIICTCDKKEKNNIIDFLFTKAKAQNKYYDNEEKEAGPLENNPRLYPVGRLDKDSEGLILLTNDGDFANRMMHPRYEHSKEYLVTVKKDITRDFIEALSAGIYFEEEAKTSSACSVEQVSDKQFRIILKEGFNRQIRRMCEKLGNEVKELIRIRIEKMPLEGLESAYYARIEGDKLEALFNYKK